MATNPQWVPMVKGDPDSEHWEISVVHVANTHGQRSWGWFNQYKLLISHNGGPCHWPMAPGLGERMVALACEVANELNRKESDPT